MPPGDRCRGHVHISTAPHRWQAQRLSSDRSFAPSRAGMTKTVEGLVQTSAGGERRAVSMTGSIRGFGANIIIIDDPQKADEALSEKAREAVHTTYTNTILSRLNDKQKGVVVLVAQRIHDDDLAGRLIASKDYACLQLPAIATEREQVPLGPEQVRRSRDR